MSDIYAFSASVEHDIFKVKDGETIMFDAIENTAHAYSNGVYQCQKDGLYSFSFSVGTKSTTTVAGVHLMVNGQQVARCLTGIADGTQFVFQAGSTMMCRMRKGEKARVVAFKESQNIAGGGYSTFSGYRLGD